MRRVFVATAVLVLAAAGVVLAVSLRGSAGTSASASGPTTVRTVLRPVHRDGTPVAGWQVSAEQVQGVTCTAGTSPAAVDSGIRQCGYTALGTISCWRSTGHTVLCLRDAYRRQLVRLVYTGGYAPVAPPRHPAPQGLTLSSGTRCHIRDGGAWDVLAAHPSWVGAYWCSGSTLYGPASGYGIDTREPLWTVHEVTGTGRAQAVRTRSVAHAYLIGTAA